MKIHGKIVKKKCVICGKGFKVIGSIQHKVKTCGKKRCNSELHRRVSIFQTVGRIKKPCAICHKVFEILESQSHHHRTCGKLSCKIKLRKQITEFAKPEFKKWHSNDMKKKYRTGLLKSPMSNPVIREKARKTKMKRYGRIGGFDSKKALEPTVQENMVWIHLKKYGFLQQYVISFGEFKKGLSREKAWKVRTPPYCRVDFANPEKKLAVNIDGSSHDNRRIIHDDIQDRLLNKLGWKIMRFTNSEIENEIKTAIHKILES